MSCNRLPNRCAAQIVVFEHDARRYRATYGFFADGEHLPVAHKATRVTHRCAWAYQTSGSRPALSDVRLYPLRKFRVLRAVPRSRSQAGGTAQA